MAQENKMLKYLLLLPITLLLTGCFTTQMPSIQTYSLSYEVQSQPAKTIDKSLKVYEPKMFSYLNNVGIVYVENKNEYQHYALNKWSERPSKMIQNLIVQHLNSIRSFNFVATNNIDVHSNYRLISEIDDFSQYFEDNISFVKFQIRIYLIDENNNTAFKSFYYKKQCSSNNAKGAVNAFNEISNQFIQDLSSWLHNTLNK